MSTLPLERLLLFPRTRAWAALCCVVFQALGIGLRLRANKSALPDLGLFTLAAAFLASYMDGVEDLPYVRSALGAVELKIKVEVSAVPE